MPVQPRRAYQSDAATETVRLSGVGFGYAATHRALRDVNLTLPAGSFHFLTGASGAGKSTLLKLLTLAEHPTSGTLHLFGEDATAAPRRALPAFRRRMGVVFQDFRLLDHLSAFDNVALPLRLVGRKQADYAGDVEEMLDWVGLGDRMDDRPPSLSGGEKQRLAIARAVVSKPELILADEPTGNLDRNSAQAVFGLLLELCRERSAALVLVTHDTELAARADRVLHLQDGVLQG